MQFALRRVILFTADLAGMSDFYQNVLGLALLNSEAGWREFDAGGCRIALHLGKSSIGTRSPKFAFHADDVAAARSLLIARGATGLGKVKSGESFDMCDGKDPDGNRFQISGRK
jgi:catechol 2,3-dioxygenase-like lactoylglutathione lyase family enzyme